MSFSLRPTNKKGVWVGQYDIFSSELFVNGISTRFGGFSAGELSSLNLGLHVGDDPEKVWENRKAFCEALGVDANKLFTCEQVHGDKIVKVSNSDAGRGAREYSDSIEGTDALITNEAGLPLMLFFADCTPIMLADPVKKAIGVAHGGWKGTIKAIAKKTVEKMVKEYGSNPADIVASVGPNIGFDCYEVGSEVADKFDEEFPQMRKEILKIRDGHTYLDLARCNLLQLVEAGLPEKNIDVANVCTACNSQLFFSYRASKGKTGRIGALLFIK